MSQKFCSAKRLWLQISSSSIHPAAVSMDDAIEQILALASAEILYISCNPETQAKNMQIFLQNGYSLEALQPVINFPTRRTSRT